jgi:hypothetical protein
MSRKYLLLTLLALVLAGAVIWSVWGEAENARPYACTLEAKVCPDGSTVGRTGPNCEFASCPDSDLKLYYYNSSLDTDTGGNLLCSSKGLVAVTRRVPGERVTLTGAIELLLTGQLTPEEKRAGITTEFPLDGLELASASQSDDTAILTFTDPNNKTSGGSCRVSVLRSQITATARQFPGVNQVVLLPAELFQP